MKEIIPENEVPPKNRKPKQNLRTPKIPGQIEDEKENPSIDSLGDLINNRKELYKKKTSKKTDSKIRNE